MAVQFFIAGESEPLTTGHPRWADPLPISAQHFGDDAIAATVSHGDYFTAVRDYLAGAGKSHLAAARCAPYAGQRIDIVLEKHGAFYHPARLVLRNHSGRERWLALNVAVTPVGVEVMESEVAAFSRVRARLPERSLPHVYGQDMVDGPGVLRFGMLLTDWLRGFHEFHLAHNHRTGELGIRIWDPAAPGTFLHAAQATELYRKTAELLARAYDPETTAQIYPWHHASGDFVVRIDSAGVALKLISVRQYAATLATKPGDQLDSASQAMALLVFFLNTTLRLRLDRIDGTGSLAWAGAAAVPAAVNGLFGGLPRPWRQILRQSLADLNPNQCTELLQAVAERYQLMPGEAALLTREAKAHAAQIIAAVAAAA